MASRHTRPPSGSEERRPEKRWDAPCVRKFTGYLCGIPPKRVTSSTYPSTYPSKQRNVGPPRRVAFADYVRADRALAPWARCFVCVVLADQRVRASSACGEGASSVGFCVPLGRPRMVGASSIVDGARLQFPRSGLKSSQSINVPRSARARWLSEAVAPFFVLGAVKKEVNVDAERP